MTSNDDQGRSVELASLVRQERLLPLTVLTALIFLGYGDRISSLLVHPVGLGLLFLAGQKYLPDNAPPAKGQPREKMGPGDWPRVIALMLLVPAMAIGLLTIVGAAVREGRSQCVNDVRRDPRYITPPGVQPPQAELAIPILLGGEVLGVLNVESERAQALYRVDDEQNVAPAAVTADRGQVVAKPAAEFDEAQGHDAGAVVDQIQNLFALEAAIAFARHFHLDAEFAFDPHPRDYVGREFAIGGDDVVAFAPIDAVRDHRQTRRRVRREGYLVRLGVDQPGSQLARLSDRGEPIAVIDRAVLHHVARVSLHPFVNRG